MAIAAGLDINLGCQRIIRIIHGYKEILNRAKEDIALTGKLLGTLGVRAAKTHMYFSC